jgi:hypothetical protein
MASIIMNMLSDIKAGKSVGIVKEVAVNPRDQLMYERKDGVTIGQHLDEFNKYQMIKAIPLTRSSCMPCHGVRAHAPSTRAAGHKAL